MHTLDSHTHTQTIHKNRGEQKKLALARKIKCTQYVYKTLLIYDDRMAAAGLLRCVRSATENGRRTCTIIIILYMFYTIHDMYMS